MIDTTHALTRLPLKYSNEKGQKYLRANCRASNSIKGRNCLLVQAPFRNVENEPPRKDERKWKIMHKPCCRCYQSKRKDKKVENRIKTEDDKGRERMRRRGVATLAETFRDFSGGPLKTLAKQGFIINLVEYFSFLPHLSSSLFLSSSLLLFFLRFSFKCNNNKWKEAAFTMPLITFYLTQWETVYIV